jgi:hypothetical protein
VSYILAILFDSLLSSVLLIGDLESGFGGPTKWGWIVWGLSKKIKKIKINLKK